MAKSKGVRSLVIDGERGDRPAPRFGHTATLVGDSRVVVFGGCLGDMKEYTITADAYSLDLPRRDWAKVVPDPAGHTMVFNKPVLIVCGGSVNNKLDNDVWVLDVENSPFMWSEVNPSGKSSPLARVYHSADVCRDGSAAGMMVVFGGRTKDNRSLKDVWGLRQHRDRSWDWCEPKKGNAPEARFQHIGACFKQYMLIIGGRGADVNKALPTCIYDTAACEWRTLTSANDRFRTSAWISGTQLYSFGGFDHRDPSLPTHDLMALDLENAFKEVGWSIPEPSKGKPSGGGGGSGSAHDKKKTGVQISNQVLVVSDRDFTNLVKKVAIDSLEEESRKLHGNSRRGMVESGKSSTPLADGILDRLLRPTQWQPPYGDNFPIPAGECLQLCDEVFKVFKSESMLLELRAPIKIYGDVHGQFGDLMRLFARYKAPMDGEMGDIDAVDYLFLGDFVDRGNYSLEVVVLLFALKVKYPTQIHMIRGNHEDPTINAIYGFREECKRRLREDPDAPNSCWIKFNSVFEFLPMGALIEKRIFCIHGGIGGSIETFRDVDTLKRPLQVAQIPSSAAEQKVTDLLWSDPSDSDAVKGVTMNETRDPDGTGRIFKFGPDRVQEFLNKNAPCSLIVRAHECVMDGFERFAAGKLITLFSATDYCGHHKNAGALLYVRRDLTIVPKLIYPADAKNTPEHAVRNLVLSVCDLKQNGECPPERVLGQAVTVGTRMYLHGGCTSSRAFDEVYLLELEQMKWSELPASGQKPSPRYGHSLEHYNKHLICFGGMCSAEKGDDLLAGNGAVAKNLSIIGTGLPKGAGDSGCVYTMETQTLIWTKYAAEPSHARYCHSASVVGDSMVVFGGLSAESHTPLNDVLLFDLQTKSWKGETATSGSSPTPRYGHKSIGVGNEVSRDFYLIVFGGLLEDNQLYSLNASTLAWSKVVTQGTSPLPRRFHSFDVIGSRAFVFGGRTETGLTDLYILDWEEKRWKRPLYEGQTNVRGHAAATLHDKLLVFGGVRDKKDAREVVIEEKISKKLFFLNVLAIKEGVNEGDFKFKLVTVGDSGVGKSCLLTRFVQDFYADFHVSTIGVDFKTVVTMVKGKLVKLQLWDTAGQERFSVVTGNYYRNSDGFLFVYDATNRTSFEHVDQWMDQVQQHHDCGPNTMKILVGNKHDLKDQIQVPESEGMAKASKMGAIFMCTSAKTAANVDMAFLSAATNLVEMRKARAAVNNAASSGGGGGGIGLTAQGSGPGGGNAGAMGSKCNCK
eukprot:g8878.t1